MIHGPRIPAWPLSRGDMHQGKPEMNEWLSLDQEQFPIGDRYLQLLNNNDKKMIRAVVYVCKKSPAIYLRKHNGFSPSETMLSVP